MELMMCSAILAQVRLVLTPIAHALSLAKTYQHISLHSGENCLMN